MPTSLLTVTPLTASGISTVIYDFPSQGLVGWYDASQIAGIVSGTSLSAWTDLSGLAHHASCGSAARQPVYVTNVKNGLPVVRFWSGATSSILSAPFTQTQPTTVVATFSLTTNTGAAQQRILDGGTAASMLMLAFGSLPVPFNIFAGATLSASTITLGNWYVGTGVFNGASSFVRVNASGDTTGNAGSAAPGGIAFGSSVDMASPIKGDIAEVVMYNRVLSAAEYAKVESYMTTKWSVP